PPLPPPASAPSPRSRIDAVTLPPDDPYRAAGDHAPRGQAGAVASRPPVPDQRAGRHDRFPPCVIGIRRSAASPPALPGRRRVHAPATLRPGEQLNAPRRRP